MDFSSIAIAVSAVCCVAVFAFVVVFKKSSDNSSINIDFDNEKLRENKLRF